MWTLQKNIHTRERRKLSFTIEKEKEDGRECCKEKQSKKEEEKLGSNNNNNDHPTLKQAAAKQTQ
jgi:hypothetical protein